MKRVSQLDCDGCGIACVAMIAGVSYHDARKFMVGDHEVIDTSTTDIREALAHFGIACAGGLVRSTSNRHYRSLKQDAILRTRTRRADNDSHWIVWDAKRKIFHDPEKYKEDRYLKPPVTSYLLVKR